VEEIEQDNDRDRNTNYPKQYAAHNKTSIVSGIASGIVSSNPHTMQIMRGSSMADRITLQCPTHNMLT
jgi:hypothetical protein